MALIDWLAPIHMNAAMATSQIRLVTSRFSPWARVQPTGSAISATAISRPTQAAATVATAGRPEAFHTMARSIRPPSSGRPGSRLNTPTTMLAQHTWRTMTQATVPDGTTCSSPKAIAASTKDRNGPAADTVNSRPGVCGSTSISDTPPSG